MEYLERVMQRVRNKLNTLQKDPTQTPFMSLSGIWPRKIVEQDYQDYHNRDQGKIQDDIYADQYPTIEQQIGMDAILSRQLHEEEHEKF